MKHCRMWCLIREYTVCHSPSNFETQHWVVNCICSNFRRTMVQKLRENMVASLIGDSFTNKINYLSTLKAPITTIVICFVFCWLLLKVIVANSVDPDQTAPLGAVWSGSTLFAYTCICLYAKSMVEKFARRCSRRHKQTTFSDAGFLGILRVK